MPAFLKGVEWQAATTESFGVEPRTPFFPFWVRNRVFRIVHLGTIGIVAALAALDVPCPLTVLEDWLRIGASGPQGFVQRWVGNLMYYDLPGWVFAVVYVAFLTVVAVTWRCVPPRR
ncbi:DUF2784 domain-containing protein [Burkholderia stagnalis]|uniref:DUF2784 domain-containing protein n=1 Tax=Burkholderia stagnalis TaxID=1503054 RepID=UPI0009C09102|nr:DUF2784 domain-containing protein [Burkholderia stagnalis]